MSRMSWHSKLSLFSSALIVAVSVMVVLAHVVLPITPETVYTGVLTVTGAIAFGSMALLLLVDLAAIALAKLAARERVSRLVSALLMALAACVAMVLLTGYMTVAALGGVKRPTPLLWGGVVMLLVAAFATWRAGQNGK